MAKKQKDLSNFVKVRSHHRKGHVRTRKGKKEYVKPAKISQYFRKKQRERLSKARKKNITEGKAKRLITEQEKKEINKPIDIQMNLYNKPTDDAYQKELNTLMQQIYETSGMRKIEDDLSILKDQHLEIIEEHEEDVKEYNNDRKEAELKIKALKKLRKALKTGKKGDLAYLYEDEYERLKDKVYAIDRVNERIEEAKEEREEAIEKIYEISDRSGYEDELERIEAKMKNKRKEVDKFYFNFIDDVNDDLEKLKEEEGFNILRLNDDLTLTMQKPEEHTFVMDDKKITAPFKSYDFDQLEQDTKRDIIDIIRNEFNEEYIKAKEREIREEDKEEKAKKFLESFKDKRKKKKKTKQRKLDKELGINTELAEEYDDLKAFDKKQKRLL